jgi:adenine-specific DNA-methyltransferase
MLTIAITPALQAPAAWDDGGEDPAFLKTQLITCIGNKRALAPLIQAGLAQARARLGMEKLEFLDLFSGSGLVARLARPFARRLICNDLEPYSQVLNACHQANAAEVDQRALARELERLSAAIATDLAPGFITELYAPADDADIKPGERVFYTRRNALFLDSFCRALTQTPPALRAFALAPVLAQASVHANTAGVFKGFYKNRAGVGQFGGAGRVGADFAQY